MESFQKNESLRIPKARIQISWLESNFCLFSRTDVLHFKKVLKNKTLIEKLLQLQKAFSFIFKPNFTNNS